MILLVVVPVLSRPVYDAPRSKDGLHQKSHWVSCLLTLHTLVACALIFDVKDAGEPRSCAHAGTISFTKNGTWLGSAFTLPPAPLLAALLPHLLLKNVAARVEFHGIGSINGYAPWAVRLLCCIGKGLRSRQPFTR